MIKVQDLTFSYKKKELFSHLELNVEPGLYGLLGKNGAGKSSLFKIMAGLLFPQEGEVTMLGEDPKRRTPQLLREIFFLTEEFSLPAMSGKTYLELNAPFYPRFNRDRFMGYMDELKLDIDQKLSTMSYGQKKKYLLAFGLASEAQILLLDEPSNGLDIPSKTQFRRLISSALTEDRCIIISTHQVRDVENLIDPIIIVDEGKIIFQHSLEEISNGIHVEQRDSEPGEGEVLYAEKALGGWFSLVAGADEEGRGIDLELLFNGVIQDADRINALIKGGN